MARHPKGTESRILQFSNEAGHSQQGTVRSAILEIDGRAPRASVSGGRKLVQAIAAAGLLSSTTYVLFKEFGAHSRYNIG
jgi:hypothetical protein